MYFVFVFVFALVLVEGQGQYVGILRNKIFFSKGWTEPEVLLLNIWQ